MLVARLEVLGEIDERGAVRFAIADPTTLRLQGGKPIDVLIENFSRTGFLFVAQGDFPRGTLVAIGLSGAGSREARVVWRDGDRHGCEFLVPLPQSKMARAFRGQADRVAALEAALQRRLGASGTPGASPSPPAPTDPDAPKPPRGTLGSIRRLFPR